MDNETIIKLLDKQEGNIKEFITATNSVVHAKLINNIEQVERKVDSIAQDVSYSKEHNVKQNGWIQNHTEKLELLAGKIVELEKEDISVHNYQANCPANRIALRVNKKGFWVGVSLLTTLVYFILATLYHEVGIGNLIKGIISKL